MGWRLDIIYFMFHRPFDWLVVDEDVGCNVAGGEL